MSKLFRLPGINTVPGSTQTVESTITVTDTVIVCNQEPQIDIQTIYVGNDEDLRLVGETIIIEGPLTGNALDSFVESQPDGTTIIIVTTLDETHEVCFEQSIEREETSTLEIYNPGGIENIFESGWTSGADSKVSLLGNGSFQFKIKETSIAVFCGLNDASLSVDPLEINYAFYGTKGVYTTYPGLIEGVFTDSTIFKIERVNTKITWYVDDVEVHSILDGKTVPLWADASLFATDDAVIDASFVDISIITGEQLIGNLPIFFSNGSGDFPDIKGIGISSLPLLVSLSTGFSSIFGSGASLLPALTSVSYIGTGSKGLGVLPNLVSNATGTTPLVGSGASLLPALTSVSYIGTGSKGIGNLPIFFSNGSGDFPDITGAATLPNLLGGGWGAFINIEGIGFGLLPGLLGTASGDCPIFGSGASLLPALIGIGYVSTGGKGLGVLPSFTGIANSLPIPLFAYSYSSLPRLVGYSIASIEVLIQGNGDGFLPKLKGFATENFSGYGSALLPSLAGRSWIKTNSAYLLLGNFIFSSYGGTENWTGACFYDPIHAEYIEGLKNTWLKNPEKRIETYFGLLGSNTRTLTIKRDYSNVGGALAYIATYYQSNIPQRFELATDLLDFVKPSTTSAGLEIDRILAHELTHAVMNDRINTLSWPGWFSEGLCEFIHGAAHRVKEHLKTESIASLLSALNENVSGHESMTSRHYAAGYLAVWKLHLATAGGIKTLLLDMATGATLNNTISNNTSFFGIADFLSWMTGSNGRSFVQQLDNLNAFSQADTGAIGGFVVDGGPILDNQSVIPD